MEEMAGEEAHDALDTWEKHKISNEEGDNS